MKPFLKYAFLLTSSLVQPLSMLRAEEVKTKDVNCEVEFDYDSTNYNKEAMTTCLKAIPDHKLDFFYVYTSASMEGSQEYNQKLTDARAKSVVEQLKSIYPDVRTEIVSGGENVRGRKAKVTAILVDERPVKRLESSITEIKEDIKAWRKNRFVAHAAIAEYRPTDTNYELLGAEYARLFDGGMSKPMYFELGLGSNYYSDDDVLDLYSIDVFGGAYYRVNYWQAGLRAKGGYLSRTDNKESTINVGGEARLGAEGERFSVFGAYGFFKDFRTYGIELGVRL